MVAGVEVTVVHVVFLEIRSGLSGMADGATAILDGCFHAVTEPARKRECGDDAGDLVLWVIVLVGAIRGVMTVSHEAIADYDEITLNTNKQVAIDIFDHRRHRLVTAGLRGVDEPSSTCDPKSLLKTSTVFSWVLVSEPVFVLLGLAVGSVTPMDLCQFIGPLL